MKPIRVETSPSLGDGTWVDTVQGPADEPVAVVVLDDGQVVWLYLGSFRVARPNEVRMRVM